MIDDDEPVLSSLAQVKTAIEAFEQLLAAHQHVAGRLRLKVVCSRYSDIWKSLKSINEMLSGDGIQSMYTFAPHGLDSCLIHVD